MFKPSDAVLADADDFYNHDQMHTIQFNLCETKLHVEDRILTYFYYILL